MVRKTRAKLVLQLRQEGFSARRIAAQGMSRHSVSAVLEAADREGLTWEDATELTGGEVHARLFLGRGGHESVYQQPEWEVVHKDLAKVGVTLKLLHAEYILTVADRPVLQRWGMTCSARIMRSTPARQE